MNSGLSKNENAHSHWQKNTDVQEALMAVKKKKKKNVKLRYLVDYRPYTHVGEADSSCT